MLAGQIQKSQRGKVERLDVQFPWGGLKSRLLQRRRSILSFTRSQRRGAATAAAGSHRLTIICHVLIDLT